MQTTSVAAWTSPIGRRTPRVDGPQKVSGAAKYTSDFNFPGQLYAVPVEATIANGRITSIDASEAEKMPGVRAVLHRANIGTIYRSMLEPEFQGVTEERRPPFEDDVIRYYGQYVAVAVAETFETAKAAADAVRVTYASEKPNVDAELEMEDEPEVVETTFGPRKRMQEERGDAESAFNAAPVKLDQTYVTPTETHNPLELHATTADVGRVDVDGVRLDARSRQLPQRAGANVRLARGERPRHQQIPGIGIRRQAVALDAYSACGRCGAKARQAGQAGRQPQDDVSNSRPPAAHATASATWRDPGRKARRAAARLRVPNVDARRPSRRLRRIYGNPVQRPEHSRNVRTHQAKHRRTGRLPRPWPSSGALRHRVGDERTRRPVEN